MIGARSVPIIRKSSACVDVQDYPSQLGSFFNHMPGSALEGAKPKALMKSPRRDEKDLGAADVPRKLLLISTTRP